MSASTVDRDEYGEPVSDRYRRLGASGKTEGIYVRFEPGFGLNVYIGFRRHHSEAWKRSWSDEDFCDHEGLGLGIDGWERLCELADEWREREAGRGSERSA